MSQSIINAVKTTRGVKKGFQRPWYIFDASTQPLGRLSTEIARVLTGKNRADYSPDVDMGGMVVVINASKTILTGKKPEFKHYFTHTGRPGSLKARSFKEQIKKDATRPVYRAVKGMLPKNRHQDLRLNNRLFIFEGKEHNIQHKFVNQEVK